jgi:chitin disaccharide deacetylase
MSPSKRLIVNADDFGRTAGINRGIVEAHRHGIVTSATVMVNYPAALELRAIARENPRLGLGLHVQLTGGPSALPAERLRSVVDAKGHLPGKPEGLRDPDPAEVLAEARAQLARFVENVGRLPTHFDSHHHSHRTPAVFEALVTLGKETERPLRNPSPELAARLRREGIRTTDRFLESFFDQRATLDALVDIIGRIEPGSTELMCHPAVVDEELRSSSGYSEPRDRERAVLTSEEVQRAVREAGVELIHFGQL